MKRLLSASLAALGVSLFSTSALADITYTYTTQSLPAIYDFDSPVSPDPIVVTFAFTFTNNGGTLLRSVVNAPGIGTIDLTNLAPYSAGFNTDENGQMTSWGVSAVEDFPIGTVPGTEKYEFQSASYHGGGFIFDSFSYGTLGPNSAIRWQAVSTGTWTADGMIADMHYVTTIPEARSASMMMGGLVFFAAAAGRRRALRPLPRKGLACRLRQHVGRGSM